MTKVEHYPYMVCVKCMTYNQANYIEQTLDGFTMQETKFPYVCVVIDDASTDGEPQVILHYLQTNFDLEDISVVRQEETDDYTLTFTKHKINRNCHFVVLFLKYNHYLKKNKDPYYMEWADSAKYTAHCEGDDYWTDHLKLQKQVDFLETHPNYVLTCHRYSVYNQENHTFKTDGHEYLFKDKDGISFDSSIKQWITKTLTLMYRTEAAEDFKHFPGIRRDTILIYILLKHGLGFCSHENMGVYRRCPTGVVGMKSKCENSLAIYRTNRSLYNYDSNSITRERYYISFINAFYYTHGKALKEIKFVWQDIYFLPYYLIKGMIEKVLSILDKTIVKSKGL